MLKVLSNPLQCKKCLKIFSKKDHLSKHLTRKFPCDVDLSCPKCKEVFKYNSILQKHLSKKNKCVTKVTRKRNKSKKLQELELELEIKKMGIREKEMELKIIEARKEIQPTQNNSNCTVNNDNRVTNNIEVNIVNFHDKMDVFNAGIPIPDKECIKNVEENNFDTMKNWYGLCFNNPKLLEYQCVKKTKNKEKEYIAHGSKGWELCDFKPKIQYGILNLAENTSSRLKEQDLSRRKQKYVDSIYTMIVKHTSANMDQIKKCFDDAIPEETSQET